MKTLLLPQTDLRVSAVILGMMRVESLDDADLRRLVNAARDAGVDFFDHADMYTERRHGAESRFGAAMALSPAERGQIVLQSKVGIRDGWYDFSHGHIVTSVDETLAALRTDYLDVLLLHRPDALVEPDEVAEAFDELHASGRVRHFGVSNHSPGQVELLRRSIRQPLIINQMQISLTQASVIASGMAVNVPGLAQSVDRDNGVLDYSRLTDMTVQAWSPFQRNWFDGSFIDHPDHPELNARLRELADAYGSTPSGIAVAWLTRHPAGMQVVIGTTKPHRVAEAASGSDVVLTREEWYSLFRVAGNTVP